jgi:acyl dehydratase
MNKSMTPAPLALNEFVALAGGAPFVSRWLVVDQARIDAFAEVTEDWQFIHTDPKAARATPFGGTIAHGFLTVALLSAMAEDALPPLTGVALRVNYGFDRLRFVTPVKVNSRVRGRFALIEASPRGPREWLMRYDTSVEIEGGERPALAALWLAMVVAAA